MFLNNLLYLQYSKIVIAITYFLITKLPWPGDSEGTFRSGSQAATCPPAYHKR